jgi:hypothetical protein
MLFFRAIVLFWQETVKVYATGTVDMTTKAAYIVGRSEKDGETNGQYRLLQDPRGG